MKSRSASGRERGAVTTIVAALAAGGVLLGMLAFSVDVGNMMFERRQLQNGADATAMALAQICAKDLDDCDPVTSLATLGPLNDLNAADSAGHGLEGVGRTDTVNGQCGRVPGVSPDVLPRCDSATSTADPVDVAADLTQCTALPEWLASPSTIPYVETYTRTESNAGPVLDFFFKEGGATLTACARAAWGPPGSTGETFPLTIGLCDWLLATNNGAQFVSQSPPYHPPAGQNPLPDLPEIAEEHVWHVLAHSKGNASTPCGPTKFAPGGFGWLKDEGGCIAVIGAIGNVTGAASEGDPPDGDCQREMKKYLNTEVLIPVFSDAKINGDITYTMAGITSFYLAGWGDVEGAQPDTTTSVYNQPTYLPGSTTEKVCEVEGQKATCIWGWFTSPLLPAGTISPDVPSRGPSIVQPAG